jgi:hypothetical protein
MAKYKLVLTVKDNYGKEKEVDGGEIDIALDELSAQEITTIADALDLDALATDIEVDEAIASHREDIYDDTYMILGGSAAAEETD